MYIYITNENIVANRVHITDIGTLKHFMMHVLHTKSLDIKFAEIMKEFAKIWTPTVLSSAKV